MSTGPKVASPPARPLMIFDGDCRFCRLWIERWRQLSLQRADFLPLQDPSVSERFPEIRREDLEHAVHLITPDGNVYRGAEAAYRVLALNPTWEWLKNCYEHFPTFASVSEGAYRLVARHRSFFSFLTRLGWGSDVRQPQYQFVRSIFLRGLGIIYLIAFVSLWSQISGLVGHDGIDPADRNMAAVRESATAQGIGLERYHIFPTLCWLDASDSALKWQCAAGSFLAVVLVIGIAPVPCLFLLWLLYLSLSIMCREFLSFQWDILLLETGFLSIFLAPLQFFPRAARAAPPSRIALWLLRWLLFALMLESGWVKLLSRDPTWHGLTALDFHYETQPLPTWIGWYAHQLPHWFQATSTVVMFALELVVPFLIFGPRRFRQFAAAAFIFLQVCILLTGNYCFFNLLAIALSILLLDDAGISNLLPKSWRRPSDSLSSSGGEGRGEEAPSRTHRPLRWSPYFMTPVACVILLISFTEMLFRFGKADSWPNSLKNLTSWCSPFRTINSYGLFAVMTTSRLEIVIEGSDDGVNWKEYEFKYKPGDVKRRPGFVAPHQPRLDWQMWFAALGNVRQNPWFESLCVHLLQGSKPVLELLATNPFPNAPPRYIRAVAYQYHFTDFATRRATGAWWQRTPAGTYLERISLRENPRGE